MSDLATVTLAATVRPSLALSATRPRVSLSAPASRMTLASGARTLTVGDEGQSVSVVLNAPDAQLEIVRPAAANVTLELFRFLRGPSGAYGADATFVHLQGVPSDTWTIVHNLGKYPSVMVQDSAGDEVEGGITYVDFNTVSVTFTGAFSGRAILN